MSGPFDEMIADETEDGDQLRLQVSEALDQKWLQWLQRWQAAISADPDSGALRDSRWSGLSALAAYKFTPRLEGIVRVDHLRNAKHGGGLLGYALTGTAVQEKLALNRQLPALLA